MKRVYLQIIHIVCPMSRKFRFQLFWNYNWENFCCKTLFSYENQHQIEMEIHWMDKVYNLIRSISLHHCLSLFRLKNKKILENQKRKLKLNKHIVKRIYVKCMDDNCWGDIQQWIWWTLMLYSIANTFIFIVVFEWNICVRSNCEIHNWKYKNQH